MSPHATLDLLDPSAPGLDAGAWIEFPDLLGRCMGNHDLANRILTRFRGGLDDTLRQLQELAGREDWGALAKRTHRFKGEAGNVGCRPLAELAARVEDACVQGTAEPVTAALARLAQACGLFQRTANHVSDVASTLTAGGCTPVSLSSLPGAERHEHPCRGR